MPIQAVSAPAIKPPGNAGVLIFSTLVLCAAFGDVSTGLFVPAMPSLGEIFRKPPETIQLTIASFAIMFAIGQLFFGPFSDRSGRRAALLIGAALTMAGSMTAAMADGVWMIIGGRAVQGLGAGAGYVVARAMVRDIYGPEGSARAMASLFSLVVMSFMTATILGGALLELSTWRAGFVVAAAGAAIWLASAILIMPETRPRAYADHDKGCAMTRLGPPLSPRSSLDCGTRSATHDGDLERMRAAAWHRHGVAALSVHDITDPWLRQAIINEATRRWGARKAGGSHGQ